MRAWSRNALFACTSQIFMPAVLPAGFAKKLGDAPSGIEQAEIPAAPKADFYPLSPTQVSLYFESQMDPDGLSYNMPGAFYLPKGTELSRLEQAFTQVVSEETLLRTGFVFGPAGLGQKVFSPTRFALNTLEAESFEQAKAQFVRPFQLEQPPLLRAAIWRDQAGRDVLFVDIHHIICDGISTPLLMKRVDQAYGMDILPDRGIQYKDYSWYLQQRGEDDAAQKYWADQLSAPPQPLELPTDRPRQKAFDYAGAKLHFTLGERQSTACERYCEQNGLSPYMLFSAAFGLVLSRLSGQSDFLIGTPVSGRTSPQLWQVLGAFIHTLPLRLRPEPQLGISAYLEQVRQSVLQMIEHQDCSLEALQKLYQQAGGRRERCIV